MFRRAAAIVCALTLAAAACGGDDDDAESGDPTGTAATTSSGPAVTASSSGGGETPVTRGGTLRYADANGPSRFDPHRSTIGQDIRFFTPVYDRLVHFDEAGELVPGLATDWSFDETGTEFTMTLREGVTFHDGAPFDAAAVKANIERGQTVEGSSISADLADITAIATPDPMTVVFTLSRPNSMLPGLLSHRAGSMVSPTAFENPDLDRAPVGAGPYRVTEYVEGDRIVYERYEDHWDTAAGGPDRIDLRILPDPTTRLNALRSGQIDMTAVGGAQLAEAEAAGYTIDSGPGLTYLVLYLNRAQSEFDDALVRRALNHAIDRQAIIDAVLFGAGDAAVQPFPESYYAVQPRLPGRLLRVRSGPRPASCWPRPDSRMGSVSRCS